MKKSAVFVALLLLAAPRPLPTFAENTSAAAAPLVPPATPEAGSATKAPAPPVPPLALTAKQRVSEPAWLNDKIDISLHEATLTEAIKAVLASAKVKGDVAVEFPAEDSALNHKVSLGFKGVVVRDALAAIARMDGGNAYVIVGKTPDDKTTTVQIRKRKMVVTSTPSGPLIFTSGDGSEWKGMSQDIQAQVRDALAQAREAIRQGQAVQRSYTSTFASSSTQLLPTDRRISLDKRDMDVRDALKDVLKQAGLDYAMEADVPTDVKKSFTFENVPISTALDVICGSVEVGWWAEAVGKTAPKENNKGTKPAVIVRIGKKYTATTEMYGNWERMLNDPHLR